MPNASSLPAGTTGRTRAIWTDENQPDGSVATVRVTSQQVVQEGGAIVSGGTGDASSATYLAPFSSAVARSLASKAGDVINAKDMGAVANGLTLSDVAMTSGSPVADSTSHTFNIFDVGKLITVAGAGAAGGPLNTTITGIQSGNAVLAANASTTISNAAATFGTDDTAAWNNSVAAATSGPLAGNIIIFPVGLSIISGSINWQPNVSLVGFGVGKSILKWISTGDMNTAMIRCEIAQGELAIAPNCQFQDFEIDGLAATQATYNVDGKGISIWGTARLICRNLYVHDTPATGIATDYGTEATISGCTVARCGRLNSGSNIGGAGIGIALGGGSAALAEGTIVSGCYLIANKRFGVFFEVQGPSVDANAYPIVTGNFIQLSAAGHGVGDCGAVRMLTSDNTIVGNASTGAGVYIGSGTLGDTGGIAGLCQGNIIYNCGYGVFIDYTGAGFPASGSCQYHVEGNKINTCTAAGIWVNTNPAIVLQQLSIKDNDIRGSGGPGVSVNGTAGVANLVLSDNDIIGNGTASGAAATLGAVALNSAVSGLRMQGNNCFDDKTSKTQTYGLIVNNVAVSSGLLDGNDLSGNLTGSISLIGSGSIAGQVTWNKGYNPQGTLAVTPAASPWTYTAGNTPEVLYLTGGTVSAVVKNGLTIAAATPAAITLDPGETVTITYSAAPTAVTDRK